MVLIQLFLSFVKIGFSAFGGVSMIPLILDEMQLHQWMTAEDMSNLVAIAEMTPGPLGLNCATFAGMRTAGIGGMVIAALGVLMPAFSFTLIAAIFFTKFKESSLMHDLLFVIKPICVAMIINVIISLGRENYITGGMPDIQAILIGILMFYLIRQRKWNVPRVIIASAIIGIIEYGLV